MQLVVRVRDPELVLDEVLRVLGLAEVLAPPRLSRHFYKEQKQIENNALSQDIQSKEKELRKAKEKERETLERQQKLDSRGRGKQEKAGVARIMLNTLRNNAENSTSKMKSVHAEKIGGISQRGSDGFAK